MSTKDDQQLSPPPTQVPPELPVEESRIIIRTNGDVVIEHLSELLAELAISLNPGSDSLQCRLDRAHTPDGLLEGGDDKMGGRNERDEGHEGSPATEDHSEGIHSSTKP